MFAVFASSPECPFLAETKEEAIAAARKLGVESFEIYDEDDRQVFSERPVPRWL